MFLRYCTYYWSILCCLRTHFKTIQSGERVVLSLVNMITLPARLHDVFFSSFIREYKLYTISPTTYLFDSKISSVPFSYTITIMLKCCFMLAILTGSMPPVWYPMFIGANECGPCNNHYYTGLMDSVRVSKIRSLTSRGVCFVHNVFKYNSHNIVTSIQCVHTFTSPKRTMWVHCSARISQPAHRKSIPSNLISEFSNA